MEINKLIYILNHCWDNDTCYPEVLNEWSVDNRSLGQCAITSLLVNDYLGGSIYKIIVNNIGHYFNLVDNEIVDLTASQFDRINIDYSNLKFKSREDLLLNADTKKRYNILKNKFNNCLNEITKIDLDINKCVKCMNLVDKFENENTIYFGKNKDILLLGEAPANNGWRKSKMLWKDTSGKVLPSGVIMQKLLEPLNIDLFDLSFIEAVKCYPLERKNLKTCNNNCKKYLYDQLRILNPKIILSLGDHATKSILNIKYNAFKEIVGKVFEVDFGITKVKVIPIYHPSPISPASYKGNIKIFEMIKELL